MSICRELFAQFLIRLGKTDARATLNKRSPVFCVQITLLGASYFGGERAQTFKTSTGKEVRLRYFTILRDSRFRSLLCGSYRLQWRYEDC